MTKNIWKSSLVLVTVVALAIAAYLFYRRNPTKPCLARPTNPTPPRPEDPNVMPGGRPEDIALAQSDPDEYAWKLFLAINRQALAGKRGLPDPARPTVREYEDDKSVIWETWALSSGGRNGKHKLPKTNTSEVFKDLGRKPDPWDQLSPEQKSLEQFPSKQFAGFAELIDSTRAAELKSTGSSQKDIQNSTKRTGVSTTFVPPTLAEEVEGIGEEVRMNRPTFDHLVEQNLYSIEGLEAAFRRFRDSPDPNNPVKIDVPAASQEIKAKWVRIREEDKPRYHWRALSKDGVIQIWGLTALHITTKDLQDWFWSDFEHVDYLDLPVHAVGANFGSQIVDRAEVESRDTTTRAYAKEPTHAARDCNGNIIAGMREETVGTKWANYRLRGTQTTFVCADGSSCQEIPTVLANTQIERGFQQTSSCITCHARATIGERANPSDFFPNRLDVFLKVQWLKPSGFVLTGAVGKVDENWFLDPKTKKPVYAQTDFMWSLSERAISTTAPTAAPTPWPVCHEPCPVPSPPKPGP